MGRKPGCIQQISLCCLLDIIDVKRIKKYNAGYMKETILFQKLDNHRVLCTACQFKCKINEGRSGVCGVRMNEKGKLFLAVYGKVSALHVDPIEKKPLYHFLPGKPALSLGTVGCNFGCVFCQNWNLSQITRTLRKKLQNSNRHEIIGLEVSEFGDDLPPEVAVQYCLDDGIPIIAYTYNEPVIFFEYANACAQMADQYGIKNIFVSNGYASVEALDLIKDRLHGINIDLKAFSNRFYKEVCKAKLQPVLDTIYEVYSRGIWLEITTLLIPGENDSESELKDIARYISRIDPNIPWHISRFHPAYLWTKQSPTSGNALKRAYEIGRSEGLRYVYLGNLPGSNMEHTYCPNCQRKLIKRSGYKIQVLPSFKNGICTHCQTKIAGKWN
jgi:pyruvate formate lyase activating enzyme